MKDEREKVKLEGGKMKDENGVTSSLIPHPSSFPSHPSSFLSLPEYDLLESLAQFASDKTTQLYLVGGTVRDIILERDIVDIDISVSGDAIQFAQDFARYIDVRAVVMDEENAMARLILRHGDLYIDFAKIRGDNIFDDLTARDFTINSMAINYNRLFHSNEVELIDNCGGCEDIKNKTIRAISEQNLIDDPVRILRAYRFAATLGFTIEDKTKNAISNLKDLIVSISAERIRDEIFKILSTGESCQYMRAMDDIGLLENIFPEIKSMKGLEQNEYHHLDVWHHSMLAMKLFENNAIPDSLAGYSDDITAYLNFELVKGRSRRMILKLIALLHDVGKPSTRSVDENGRIRFFDHYLKGAEISEYIGERLKLAKREIMLMSKVIKYHMYPIMLCSSYHLKASAQKSRLIRKFIRETGLEWLPILLISSADLQATCGPKRKESDLANMNDLIGKTAHTYFNDIKSISLLVTGYDIINEFGLPQGPMVGELLKKIRIAQLEGKIKTRNDAIEFASNMIKKISS